VVGAIDLNRLGGSVNRSSLLARITATSTLHCARADEKLTAFVELESAIRRTILTTIGG
jgi:hypothetical protein